MSNILRQVDEDLRKERILNLWKKYGLYAIFLIIILVTIVVGLQISKSIAKSNSEAVVEKYIKAINENDFKESINNLNDIENYGNTFINNLSRVKIAILLAEKGNLDEGRSELLNLIRDKEIDPLVKEFSLYLFLLSQISKISSNEINEYANNIKINESQFKYLFRELFALNAYFSDDLNLARERFSALINDIETPNEISIRAKKFQSGYF